MNGPGTDSLTIRHTPGTVPGGARPGWGLPFTQLPVATRRDLTPESILEQETQAGRQQIQDKYTLQWKEVSRSKRFIGATKANQMLRQIDMRAKQEMLQFNQQAQAQLTQLRNVDRLAEQGAIADPEQIKARITLDPAMVKAMYPERQTPEQQLNTLETQTRKVEDRLAQFRIIGEKLPKPPSRLLWAVSPPLAAISAYRRISELKGIKKRGRKGDVQIFDRTIPVEVKDEKTGEIIIEMGAYRTATPEEIMEEKLLREQLKEARRYRIDLLGQSDVSRRIMQPGVRRSGFDVGIAESIRPQQRPTKRLRVSDPLGLR